MEITILDPTQNNNQTTMTVPDGKWIMEIDVSTFLNPMREDHRLPHTLRPLVVPASQLCTIVGVERGSVQLLPSYLNNNTIEGHSAMRNQRYTVIADKPFGVVYKEEGEPFRHRHAHRYFQSARQVHKGELGRSIPIRHMPRVLQTSMPHPKNRKLGNLNLVQLTRLCQITGLGMEELIRRYVPFSPSRYYELNLPVVLDYEGEDGLREKTARWMRRYYLGGMPAGDGCAGECAWGGPNVGLLMVPAFRDGTFENAWVPQSWAQTVLRLHSLGYSEESEGFRVAADAIEPDTEGAFPVLPAIDLTDYTRGRSAGALDKIDFMRRCEEVLGMNGWTKSWESHGNRTPGFITEDNFRVLKLLDGRVEVALGFWSRAGFGNVVGRDGDFYWCAYVRIPVEGTRNFCYQVKIFPHSLVRVTPTGSRGGLCPSDIEPEAMDTVRRLLNHLGYKPENEPQPSVASAA